MSEYFKLPEPVLRGSVTMGETHFIKWARSVPRSLVSVFNYLNAVGFVTGVDKLSETDFENLRWMEDTFLRCEPHMKGVHRMRSLVKPYEDNSNGPGYYLAGWKFGRCLPSVKLIAALRNAGWIYDINPNTTYFEYIPKTRILHARYQTIIGSRPLARIGERNEQ